VLDGKHDELPEQAFYLVGGIDDVLTRAEELKATA
jgi:F-type H+-transporting ATPase subunit beta